jgi:hypothetical protein
MFMTDLRPFLTVMLALGAAAPAAAVTFTVTSVPYTAGAPAGTGAMCGVSDPACRDRWSGAYAIVSTDLVNRHLTPSGWVGEYAAVPGPNDPKGSTATLSFAGIGAIHAWSFLWGSAGVGNVLELSYQGMGSPFVINGGHVISTEAGETATQRINRWVTITGDVAFTPTMARFAHPNYAFETTAFAIRPVIDPFIDTIPEPESWGLMIAGFGLIGATLRRRRALAA